MFPQARMKSRERTYRCIKVNTQLNEKWDTRRTH